MVIFDSASGEGGEGGRLDEEPQDLSLRTEDGSLPSVDGTEAAMGGQDAAMGGQEAAMAGPSHEILMPGSSQVSLCMHVW